MIFTIEFWPKAIHFKNIKFQILFSTMHFNLKIFDIKLSIQQEIIGNRKNARKKSPRN